MKKFFLAIPMAALLLASCGSNDDSLEQVLDDLESFDNATNSFAEGNAKNGEEYFSGLLAEVIEVDVKYREMEELDNMDASEKEINAALDSCLLSIKEARKAIDKYKDKDWPKRADFHELTIEWFAGIEGMVKKYARPLAKAMSKPDEEWTDDEYSLYEEWQEAYDKFLEVDARWVAFQHEYAAANGFTLSDETIDVDALVEEDLSK
jgi:hypothetical protein